MDAIRHWRVSFAKSLLLFPTAQFAEATVSIAARNASMMGSERVSK
jgi:hypothetical protein